MTFVFHPGDTFELPRPKVVERMAMPADATGGTLSILEIVVQPGGLVAPVHVHTLEDETMYVYEGVVGALLGKEELEVGPGGTAFLPRDVAHSFWNSGDVPARLIIAITPGNLDGYFRGLPATNGPDEIVELARSYGMELRMESARELGERHGVSMF
ncbi:cupin domain-containing protein [Tenggerimyces flavus]|uniref:Cupin domain-containing protein n=1 Tax=Tenggerimyces flavus TaxID=1708749 RepID=A0ABV7YLC8_9ACTN|nr:cupin domain-containing protein [Tenggerimyces flavus]MBM7787344.1 mannose-6-phosphate isomerase-like protein (cupin superfamily) [Tenggerimyces flavus]